MFIYIWKEGNVLFNDKFNTFYLRLYSIGHMVKDHSDSERENQPPQHGLYIIMYIVFCPPNQFICLYIYGRKEMFYLTTNSTHFIYGYIASDTW